MHCPHCGCWVETHRSPRREALERQIDDAVKRAQNAEAELANGHALFTAAGIPEKDDSGKMSIVGRAIKLRQERDMLRRQLGILERLEG